MAPSQALQQQNKRPLTYFVPGELVLVVDHPPVPDEAREEFGLILRRLIRSSKHDLLQQAIIDPERVLTFHPVNFDNAEPLPLRRQRTPFSLVFADVRRQAPDAPTLIRSIEAVNANLPADSTPGASVPTLRAAGPNWLMTPAPENIGGGSPGAWPLAPGGTPPADGGAFGLPDIPSAGRVWQNGGDAAVEVVILDTAPACKALVGAFNRLSDHRMLRELLGAGGVFGVDAALEILYASELGIDLPGLNDFRVRGHDYRMGDHGLFIAGIVHAIAPRVKIRLFEVLNEYGVGTLESIGRGLQILAEERAKKTSPLVINCSLGMTMPLAGHPTDGLDQLWTLFARKPLNQNDPQMRLLSLSLESMCAALASPNVAIVAAAGNDGNDPDPDLEKQGLKRPQARYPAAFPTVTGVGALLKTGQPADYSNTSDQPESVGYAAFGGGTAPVAAVGDVPVTDANDGMFGVYIGDFPARPGETAVANTTGWARWAGTSFATPIISAILARLAAESGTLADAKTVLDSHLDPDTGIGRVFSVTQTT